MNKRGEAAGFLKWQLKRIKMVVQGHAEAEKMIKYQTHKELEVLGIGRLPEGC